MGHGHHWGAVLKDVHQDLGQILESGVTRGEVIGRHSFSNWCGPQGVGQADITLIENSQGGFGTLGIVVTDNSSRTYLHSAFPVGSRGPTHQIQVLRVSEASFGLEACVAASLGEAKIRFFEPYYALNTDLYRTGAQLNVTLSGIAYEIEVPDPDETVVHPEIGKVHLRGAAILLPLDQSGDLRLPTHGFGVTYMLAANEGPGPDDYRFRGVVKEVEGLEFFERPAWRFKVTVLRLDEGNIDMDIHIYVLDKNIRDGQRPAVGGDIAGTLWMQGFRHSS